MTDVEESEYPMFDKHTEALEIGFKDNMKIPLKRLASFKTLIGVISAIVSLLIILFVVDFLVNKLAESGMTLSMPMLNLLMLSIPAWTISFATVTALEKKRKLNASGTAGILGRYVGVVISGIILMTIIYAAVYGIWFYLYGAMDIDLVDSYMIMVSFVALAAALGLFFNALVVHALLATYLFLFILIPLVAFFLGPYMGIMELSESSSYLPLVDTISSTATGGFGGGTILTLLFFVKSSEPVTASVFGSMVLSFGWAILFIALTIFVQYRREAKHEQQ